MRAENLDPAFAYLLAEALIVIPGAPSRKVATEVMAVELMTLCRGGQFKGEYWPPERQAQWVVHEVLKWKRWEGPAGVREMFANRFPVPIEKITSPRVRLTSGAAKTPLQKAQPNLFDDC